MILYKEDLKKIGGTKCSSEDGKYLTILCSVATAGIEEILLRNILLLFGDYKITDRADFVWDNGDVEIEFTTDFPWSEYYKL